MYRPVHCFGNDCPRSHFRSHELVHQGFVCLPCMLVFGAVSRCENEPRAINSNLYRLYRHRSGTGYRCPAHPFAFSMATPYRTPRSARSAADSKRSSMRTGSGSTVPTKTRLGGESVLRHVVHANLQRVIDAFRGLDVNGSGEIDRLEFRRGLRSLLGTDHSLHDVDAMFDSLDVGKDGRISYKEFFRRLRRHPTDGAPAHSLPTAAQSPTMQRAPLPSAPAHSTSARPVGSSMISDGSWAEAAHSSKRIVEVASHRPVKVRAKADVCASVSSP